MALHPSNDPIEALVARHLQRAAESVNGPALLERARAARRARRARRRIATVVFAAAALLLLVVAPTLFLPEGFLRGGRTTGAPSLTALFGRDAHAPFIRVFQSAAIAAPDLPNVLEGLPSLNTDAVPSGIAAFHDSLVADTLSIGRTLRTSTRSAMEHVGLIL